MMNRRSDAYLEFVSEGFETVLWQKISTLRIVDK